MQARTLWSASRKDESWRCASTSTRNTYFLRASLFGRDSTLDKFKPLEAKSASTARSAPGAFSNNSNASDVRSFPVGRTLRRLTTQNFVLLFNMSHSATRFWPLRDQMYQQDPKTLPLLSLFLLHCSSPENCILRDFLRWRPPTHQSPPPKNIKKPALLRRGWQRISKRFYLY